MKIDLWGAWVAPFSVLVWRGLVIKRLQGENGSDNWVLCEKD